MDKQSLGKLKLILMGLSGRIEEELDFFISLKGEFKSGTMIFPFLGELNGRRLDISFEGRREPADPGELPDLICGFAERFDGIRLICEFRGERLIIEADSKNVTMKTNQLEEDREQYFKGHSESGIMSGRDYFIKVGKADSLLKEIGIMADNGKIKNDMIRKYNQIDHFVELLDPMVRNLSRSGGELRVVDCACGKSYLSFVLNYYMREVLKLNCSFTGIDISEGVVAASRGIAKNLGYRNMNFIKGDIRSLSYQGEDPEKGGPDLVISLHACDVATDFALGYGIRNRARAIVAVPCCHSELRSQLRYEPFRDVLKHGVLKARMADVLTDGLRCMILEAYGYEVSAVEYVSPLDTPKNLLIRASLTGEFDGKKLEACRKFASELAAEPMLLKELEGMGEHRG